MHSNERDGDASECVSWVRLCEAAGGAGRKGGGEDGERRRAMSMRGVLTHTCSRSSSTCRCDHDSALPAPSPAGDGRDVGGEVRGRVLQCCRQQHQHQQHQERQQQQGSSQPAVPLCSASLPVLHAVVANPSTSCDALLTLLPQHGRSHPSPLPAYVMPPRSACCMVGSPCLLGRLLGCAAMLCCMLDRSTSSGEARRGW